jgi:hypothetical protein
MGLGKIMDFTKSLNIFTDSEMDELKTKLFNIRKEMLNIPIEQWKLVHKIEGEIIRVSPRSYLDNIGLPSVKSAKYNNEQREFFEVIYQLYRKGLDL